MPDITIHQRPPEKQGDMKNLFWQMNATLDGFVERPNQELDYTAHVVTYQVFAGYWPTATGPDAERLNELPKIATPL